jgi:ABC-type cobalamin/Fe3+-siderophores transport system ATPase subunit
MLQVQNITFGYTERIVLQNITSLSKRAEYIIGESGCGKSTLLKLIYGVHDLHEGHIFWNETEVLGPKYNLVPGMPL